MKFVSPFSIKGKHLKGHLPARFANEIFGRKPLHSFIMPVVFGSPESGHVFKHVLALDSSNKIASCIAHFEEGIPWEETGIIESGLAYVKKSGKPLDGCSSRADFLLRYEKLDQLFDSLSKGGVLYSDARNDAIVHINDEGEVYFGGGAHHRTAMAWILDIHIPIRPFLIHPKGKGKLSEFLYENKPLPDDLSTIWRPDPSPPKSAKPWWRW